MASIFDRRLILVTGKGGVGRSTVAAAIALECARRGRRTLLFESNAKDRFGSFFGTAPVGTQIVRLREDLHAINTNPGAALEEYGLMVLRFKPVYKMVFENRVTKYFLRAIPGLDDYSIIGKAWYHTTEAQRSGAPVWDTLVFDMPASGHTLTMLRIPKVILETVPESPLTRTARSLRDLLVDPARTALVLVTLPEEMPSSEAIELSQTLDREHNMRVARLVINQVYPDRFPVGSSTSAIVDALISERAKNPGALSGDLESLTAHAELHRSRRRLNETYIAKLTEAMKVPHTLLPFLFVPAIGEAEIELLSKQLADAPDGTSGKR